MPKPIVQEIRAVDKTKSAFNSVNRSLNAFKVAVGSIVSAQAVRGFIGIAREAEVLQASLRTATGSAEGASAAFSKLQEFAATTPFALEQSVNAFIKLKNLGLDPSIEALESYGNTAAATGKDLNQFIDAVSQAAVGEFERLKEFGIKAKSQGDQVSFIFRGVTTTVQKEAEAIEGYLRTIGDVDFAGAIEERSKTLDGALSNAGDAFNRLVVEIGNAGLTEVINLIVQSISNLTTWLVDRLPRAVEVVKTSLKIAAAEINIFASKAASATASLLDFLSSPLPGTAKPNDAVTSTLQRWRDSLNETAKSFQRDGEILREFFVEGLGGSDAPSVDPFQRLGGSATKTADSVNKAADAIRQYVSALKQEADTLGFTNAQLVEYELRKKGATQSTIDNALALQAEIDAYKAIQDIEKENADIMQASAQAAEQYRQELETFADQLTRTINPTEQLEEDLRRIDEAFSEGLISADVWGEATFNAITRAEEAMKGATEEIKKIKPLSEELGPIIADSFGDAIVEGEKFSDVLKGLEKDLIRVLTRRFVTRPLTDALGDLFGGGSGGSFFSALFGKAIGGPVSAGRPYIVGERGPEIFAPNTSGRIIPANESNRGGVYQFHFHDVKDADSFRRNQTMLSRWARTAVSAV